MRCLQTIALFGGISSFAAALSASPSSQQARTSTTCLAAASSNEVRLPGWAAATIFAAALSTSPPAFASEIGVEVEAPTFSTGETVEICTKRGPLGACLKTETRTETNDNDIAKKYFRDPSDLVKQREAAMLAESEDGNALIQKLKQQSIDNQEKNDLYVQRKTFENSQTGAFGPFDRQVVIMNTDGKTFTLLENPVAMRLKKAGFINKQRQFIRQPTQDDLDAAAKSDGGFLQGIFGGE